MHSAVFRAWCQLQRRCPLEDAEFCCVCGAFGFHAARQSSSSLTHATPFRPKVHNPVRLQTTQRHFMSMTLLPPAGESKCALGDAHANHEHLEGPWRKRRS